MSHLAILHQDDHLVVVNKPAGLLVHRSAIDRHAEEHAMVQLRDQLGRWVYPVHRLDKAASGALIFALDPGSARILTEAFTAGRIGKSYLAVVRGFAAEGGRIDHPLRVLRDRMTDRRPDRPAPLQEAVTEYERQATVELPHAAGRYATARFTLVRANPLTGRMHQLRRHMKHLRHPIIGDTTYGDGRQNEFFRTVVGCRRLLLHCSALTISHPATGEPLRVEAPLDDEFTSVLRELAWQGLTGGPLPSAIAR